MLKRFAIALLLSLFAWPCWAANLTVTLTGVKPGEGDLRFVLYNSPDSFRHEDKALAVQSVKADATPSVVFENLAPGRYAIIAYHDANGNGRLDLFMGMIPKEGWGMSNDPEVFGPPKFDPAAFSLSEDPASIIIPLHY